MALDFTLDESFYDDLEELQGDSTFCDFDLSEFRISDEDFSRDLSTIFPGFGYDSDYLGAHKNLCTPQQCNPNPSTAVASPTSQKSEESTAQADFIYHDFDFSAFCISEEDFTRDLSVIFPSFGYDSVPLGEFCRPLQCSPNASTGLASPTSPKSEESTTEKDNPYVSFPHPKVRSKRGRPRGWSSNDNDMLLPMKRRCVECGEEKTPQWRRGPKGPKTLCNACGIRDMRKRL